MKTKKRTKRKQRKRNKKKTKHLLSITNIPSFPWHIQYQGATRTCKLPLWPSPRSSSLGVVRARWTHGPPASLRWDRAYQTRIHWEQPNGRKSVMQTLTRKRKRKRKRNRKQKDERVSYLLDRVIRKVFEMSNNGHRLSERSMWE